MSVKGSQKWLFVWVRHGGRKNSKVNEGNVPTRLNRTIDEISEELQVNIKYSIS